MRLFNGVRFQRSGNLRFLKDVISDETMRRKHHDPILAVLFPIVIALFAVTMDQLARLSAPLVLENWPKLKRDFDFLTDNYGAEIASDFVTFFVISLPFGVLLGVALQLLVFRARRYAEFQSHFVQEIRAKGGFLIILRLLVVGFVMWWIFIFPTPFSLPQDMARPRMTPFFSGKLLVSTVNICFGGICCYTFASVPVWWRSRGGRNGARL